MLLQFTVLVSWLFIRDVIAGCDRTHTHIMFDLWWLPNPLILKEYENIFISKHPPTNVSTEQQVTKRFRMIALVYADSQASHDCSLNSCPLTSILSLCCRYRSMNLSRYNQPRVSGPEHGPHIQTTVTSYQWSSSSPAVVTANSACKHREWVWIVIDSSSLSTFLNEIYFVHISWNLNNLTFYFKIANINFVYL